MKLVIIGAALTAAQQTSDSTITSRETNKRESEPVSLVFVNFD
jgi:hypothetical protein